MSGREKRKKSTITVHVVDMEKAMKDIFDEEKGNLPDDVIGLNTIASKWGYVETPKGVYLLDYEACGPGGSEVPLTKEGNEIKMPLYCNREGSMEMFASRSLNIDAEFVRGLDKVCEENLVDFVRTFGGRLESNFSNWNRHLEAEINEGHTAQSQG